MIKQTLEYYNAKYGWNEEGATAIEYGILAALIAVAIIGTVTAVGGGLNATFTEVSNELGTTTP